MDNQNQNQTTQVNPQAVAGSANVAPVSETSSPIDQASQAVSSYETVQNPVPPVPPIEQPQQVSPPAQQVGEVQNPQELVQVMSQAGYNEPSGSNKFSPIVMIGLTLILVMAAFGGYMMLGGKSSGPEEIVPQPTQIIQNIPSPTSSLSPEEEELSALSEGDVEGDLSELDTDLQEL